ncbi:MAG: protein-glutamate O-methyltransferase [Planctomycetota bacterium]
MPALDDNLTDAQFKRVADIVYKHCRINLHDGKRDLVRARLTRRLQETGIADFKTYLADLEANPGAPEFQKFIDSLSTNLTSFFRESSHFDYLVKTHLSEVMRRKKAAGSKSIRGWSAGCSSGEEPYTLAITLLEALGNDGSDCGGWDVKLLASDLSTRVLSKAQAGVYPAERVKNVPKPMLARHTDPRQMPNGDAAVAMKPHVRELIKFRHLNLMEPWPFRGPFDFIFCRNVMIYFDKPTQETLVNRYHEVLAPGGVLFTGHSESLTGISHSFKYTQATIYKK